MFSGRRGKGLWSPATQKMLASDQINRAGIRTLLAAQLLASCCFTFFGLAWESDLFYLPIRAHDPCQGQRHVWISRWCEPFETVQAVGAIRKFPCNSFCSTSWKKNIFLGQEFPLKDDQWPLIDQLDFDSAFHSWVYGDLCNPLFLFPQQKPVR